MSRITDTLNKQLTAAELLLQKVVAIPDGHQGMYSIIYDKNVVRGISNEEEEWEKETNEYLILFFGEGSRQVEGFNRCLREKNQYTDFREELKHDLDKGIAFLKALIKADEMKSQLAVQQPAEQSKKTPIVFISHSSKDKAFAEALVVLLEDLGMDSTNVFCSSVDGYGVGLSQDIFETLRNLFNQHNLFVIFIHSPRYYKSPVSLNEMGAAWVLKTGFCSFLTTDMEFNDMVGVIDKSKLSLKVNTDQASSQLAELKNILIETFGLNAIEERKWDRKRKQFLEAVCNIKYEDTKPDGSKTEQIKKQAVIRAYSIKERKGQRTLCIKNEGDATATNLVVELPNGDEVWTSHPTFPVTYDEILPGTQRKITLAVIEGQNEATLLFTWDDESQTGNTQKQTIDL